jgi:hypothetical protein
MLVCYGLSCSLAVVVAKHSAQPLATFDWTLHWEWRELRSDDLVPQPLMVSFQMIMKNELLNGSVEAGFPDQNQTL